LKPVWIWIAGAFIVAGVFNINGIMGVGVLMLAPFVITKYIKKQESVKDNKFGENFVVTDKAWDEMSKNFIRVYDVEDGLFIIKFISDLYLFVPNEKIGPHVDIINSKFSESDENGVNYILDLIERVYTNFKNGDVSEEEGRMLASHWEKMSSFIERQCMGDSA
jgi:hypothetical protein